MPLTVRSLRRGDSSLLVVQQLYETAFPAAERLDFSALVGLLDDGGELLAYYEGEAFVGMTYTCRFGRTLWFFYFAVVPAARGRGLGANVLDRLLAAHRDEQVLIDIEAPDPSLADDALRNRRYRFYLRHGFQDTGVCRTFDGVTFQLLATRDAFSAADYDRLLAALRRRLARIDDGE